MLSHGTITAMVSSLSPPGMGSVRIHDELQRQNKIVVVIAQFDRDRILLLLSLLTEDPQEKLQKYSIVIRIKIIESVALHGLTLERKRCLSYSEFQFG